MGGGFWLLLSSCSAAHSSSMDRITGPRSGSVPSWGVSVMLSTILQAKDPQGRVLLVKGHRWEVGVNVLLDVFHAALPCQGVEARDLRVEVGLLCKGGGEHGLN